MPLELSRLSDQDLVDLEQFRTGSSGSGSNSGNYDLLPTRIESITGIPEVEVTEHLEENIMHRAKSYMSSKNSVFI